MELIGLILGVIALVVGLIHVIELRKQINHLGIIKESLSTRYIGRFPNYLPDIIKKIEGAKTKVSILCDLPAYGCFTDPDNFLHYRHAIEQRLQHDVKIEITCLNEEKRKQSYLEQFNLSDPEEWKKWKEKCKNKISKFLISCGNNNNLNSLTVDQLLELIERSSQRMLNDSLSRAKPHQVNTAIPLFFWIIDDQCAIFSICGDTQAPSSDYTYGEYGFITVDQTLIKAFKAMLNKY